MGISRKFAHDDIVKVIETGVPEDELELVKIANDDETGFAVRYIS
jgi:hypothetical protein